MNKVSKIVFSILIVLMGLLFLFSAYAKLDTIEQFEIQLVNYGLANWSFSKFLARIIVSFEFFLGFALLLHFKLKQYTIKVALVTLVVFTLFVVSRWIMGKEDENCGCFGELIELTPVQTLVKNLISMAGLILAWKIGVPEDWISKRWNKILLIGLPALTMTLVCIIQPPVDIYNQRTLEVLKPGAAFPTLTTQDDGEEAEIARDWYHDRKLMIFVSSTCKYCKQAVTKLNVVYNDEKYKNRVLIVFMEIPDSSVDLFFNQTGGKHFPHIKIPKTDFLKITRYRFPQLFYLNNGVVEQNIGKKELFENAPEF